MRRDGWEDTGHGATAGPQEQRRPVRCDDGVIDLTATAQARTLHLVDVENLLGDPWATGWRVGWALEQYLGVAGLGGGDLG